MLTGTVISNDILNVPDMKSIYPVLISILFAGCVSYTKTNVTALSTPEALQQWCKNKATDYFKVKNKTIEGWSALWKQQADSLDVKALLSSGGVNYTVNCRVKQGESAIKAIILISETAVKSDVLINKEKQHGSDTVD